VISVDTNEVASSLDPRSADTHRRRRDRAVTGDSVGDNMSTGGRRLLAPRTVNRGSRVAHSRYETDGRLLTRRRLPDHVVLCGVARRDLWRGLDGDAHRRRPLHVLAGRHAGAFGHGLCHGRQCHRPQPAVPRPQRRRRVTEIVRTRRPSCTGRRRGSQTGHSNS
jgi:hypothetical protein